LRREEGRRGEREGLKLGEKNRKKDIRTKRSKEGQRGRENKRE